MPALAPRLLPAAALALGLACGGSVTPTSYPSKPEVQKAQELWCQALARLSGKASEWPHLAACHAAETTASPAYLRAVSTCFEKGMSAKDGPDQTKVLEDCDTDAVVNLPDSEAHARPLIDAYCGRRKRCENVAPETCAQDFARMTPDMRAVLTTMFHEGALAGVARCLEGEACGGRDQEEETRARCYQPARDKLLYFP